MSKYVPGQFFITKKVPAKKKPVVGTDIPIRLQYFAKYIATPLQYFSKYKEGMIINGNIKDSAIEDGTRISIVPIWEFLILNP